MVELIGGLVIGGVAGVALKDKILGDNNQNNNKQREIDSLYAENEKFSKRNKELERQVEDLLAELNKVRRQAKANDETNHIKQRKCKPTSTNRNIKKIRTKLNNQS